MTPTKEPIDIGTSPVEPGTAHGKSRRKPESAHLRADAVSLEIPVKVHGSLVSNISSSAAQQAQPFEEQTTTIIIFPQGGVLKMSTAVSAGQVMVLTNLKSRQDAICRAIKVRAYGKDQSYVEVEFTSPQSGYWGVYFPTDGPGEAKTQQQQPAATPPAPAQATPALPGPTPVSAAQNAPEVSWAPAAALIPPVTKEPETGVRAEAPQTAALPTRPPSPTKLPESSFASIGTKEEVLPAASSTRAPRATYGDSSAVGSWSADTDISEAIDALIVPTSSTDKASPRTTPSERSSAVAERTADAPLSAYASPRASNSFSPETESPMPRQMFGVMLDSAAPVSEKPSRGRSGKMWMPIGIVAMLVIVAGGAYYYHSYVLAGSTRLAPATSAAYVASEQPSITQSPVSQSTAANSGGAQPVPDQSTAVQLPDSAAPSGTTSDFEGESSSKAPESTGKSGGFEPFAPRREASSASSGTQAVSATPPKQSVAIPSTAGVLKTRPVAAHHSNLASAGPAPTLDAGGSAVEPNGSLSGLSAPAPNLPAPPKPVPSGPVRVGGKIQPPRLVSSVLPAYPSLAQQAGVKGTVVIDTIIDKDGNVSKTSVISGPELLRQAALSALRQWKYEASQLNGQPISVEMIVSIQFH
jgi:TonB family protein